jgi:outer membrane protein TolC
MDQMAASLRSRLLGMLDLDPTTPLGPTRDDPPRLHPKPVDDLLRLGQEMRPEIAASNHRIRSAEERVDHARKSYLPDLTLKLDYIQIGEPAARGLEDAGKDAVAVGASINLPIWLGKNGARVREAEALAAASRSRLRGAVARTRAEIQDALLGVRASLETVGLYETSILPQAEQTFLATQAAYQTGEADFLTYLDSERAFLDLRIAHARALSDLGSRYALLERAVGIPLEEILRQEDQQEGMKP